MAWSRYAHSRPWRDRRGVAALEMVAVAPVLLLIMVACIDFGRVISQNMELSHAVRAGAQYAVTAANAKLLIEDAVKDALPAHLSTAAVTATCYCGALPSGNTGMPAVAACDSACPASSARMMKLQAVHPFTPYNFVLTPTLRSTFGLNQVSSYVTIRHQ